VALRQVSHKKLKTLSNTILTRSHSAEDETVFVGEVVTDQVVEAEDANFKDGVVRTQAQVHDRHDANKLCTKTKQLSTNIMKTVIGGLVAQRLECWTHD